MDRATKDSRVIRFSIFELDRDSGELFKQGRKVKLQGQPFELLVALLERPGEVLSREGLRQKIWPSEIAGDFDQGLNRAINKVRDALGDSAESPRFIETVPRRGYRFIGTIQEEPATPPPDKSAAVPEAGQRGRFWILVAIGAAVLMLGLVAWIALHRTGNRELKLTQLTANSSDDPVWHAVISPDGKYLAYGDLAGIEIRQISTGESHVLPRPHTLASGDAWFPAAWFPDGTRLLATSITSTAVTAWTVSVIGGTATPVRDNALAQSVSPDGSLIAFITRKDLRNENEFHPDIEIWVMGPRGENARKVVRTEHVGYLFSVHWSPNGKRLAYERADEVMGLLWRYSIESCDLNGAKPSLIVSGKSTVDPGASLDFTFPEDFWWLPGHIIYSVTDTQQNSRSTQLYSVAVDEARGTPRGRPKRIGHLPFHIQAFSGTAEGTTLASETSADQGHILIGRLSPDGKLADVRPLTHLERFEAPFAWTSDSRFVIFNSDRAGGTGIYKQAPDQSAPELLYPERPLLERVSPDGGSLIYETVSLNEPRAYSLMRLSFAGHPPQLLLRNPDRSLSFDCPHRAGVWCLGSDRTSGQQESFFAFDPASGKRNHLFDVTWPPSRTEWLHWTVSPDGSHIGMVGDDPQSRIEIRSLAGVIEKRIESKDWPNPLSLDWAADGKSVFISHVGLMDSPSGPIGATIVRLYLDGRVQPIWDTRGGHTTWVIASPDGKYLAIREPVTQRNAWMIEDF